MANLIYPADYSQARSPVYIQMAPEDGAEEIVEAQTVISIYTGDRITGLSDAEVISVTKPSPDGRILIDVSQLVRAYFVQHFTSHNALGSGVYYVNQAVGAALWCKFASSTIETDSSYTNGNDTFLLMDGYTEWADGINKVHADTILTANRIIKLLPAQLFTLPIKNDPRIKWAIYQ